MLSEATQAATLHLAELIDAADGTRPLTRNHFLEVQGNVICACPIMQVLEQQGLVASADIERHVKKIEVDMQEGHYYNLLFPALFPVGVKYDNLFCPLCAASYEMIELVIHLNDDHDLTMADTAAALRLALEPQVPAGAVSLP